MNRFNNIKNIITFIANVSGVVEDSSAGCKSGEWPGRVRDSEAWGGSGGREWRGMRRGIGEEKREEGWRRTGGKGESSAAYTKSDDKSVAII